MDRTVWGTSLGTPLTLAIVAVSIAMGATEESPQGRYGPPRRVEGYYKGQITPHWFADNQRFWYRNDLTGGTKEFILVDAEQGTRQPAFDHAKLAAALSKTVGSEYKADRLPFDTIEFADNGKIIRFAVEQTSWDCDLASYACTKSDEAMALPSADRDQGAEASVRRRGPSQGRVPSPDSPDGKWTAFIKDHNVVIRPKEGGEEIRLSADGVESNAYDRISWAPDSKTLVAFRIEPGDGKEVYLIESSPAGGGRAKFSKRPYSLPGDKFATYELNLFDVEGRKQIKPEVDKLELDWQTPKLRWMKDQRHFTYEKVDRGHQRFRVIEVDSHTGQARNLIDEKTETFIWTAHTENLGLSLVTWLDKTDEIVYASEQNGWRHLYLIDPEKGQVRNQITQGQWFVRG
ncbi:MAG TPA: DPP IV N-terminal domain-containing protein, partial [Sedimentisphaerales bacterium]|nr:DPP IV N-terminal domain-containing protein [Sedimentisphaerales bacterium]